MTFSDSDWTRDLPREPFQQRRVWSLAVLIALGCVAVAMLWFGIEQALEERARHAAFQPTVPADAPPRGPASAPAVAAPAPPEAAASSAAAVTIDAAVARQQLDALEAEMKLAAQESARQAAADAARRKERAWERWYQRPAFCSDNPTGAQMVQCANHHIRARKEFEERYAAGRL